jgi:AcrR family transcriptional regulator
MASSNSVPAGAASAGQAAVEGPRAVRRSLRRRRGAEPCDVRRDQRVRLMHAMLIVAARDGYEAASIERVREQAGMSRRTLYDLFANREDLFSCVLEAALARVCEVVAEGYAAGEPARGARIRSAVVAALVLFEAEPDLARVCLIEALAAGPKARALRRQALAPLVALIEQAGGEELPLAAAWPVPGEAILGGAQELLHARLDGDSATHCGLPELAGQLTYLLVAPTMGTRAARREAKAAERDLDRALRTAGQGHEIPAELHGLVLTDLQRRCLAYIAMHPGSSSADVGAAADIMHAAQVSRLLGVLRNAGLAEGLRPRGGAYEWTVTPLGEAALRALERPAEPEWLVRAGELADDWSAAAERQTA